MILDPWKEERRLLAKSVPLNRLALFRFTAICGLVPLYALLTMCGRGQGPGGPPGTHPQSLKAPAFRANADVAAAPRYQCSLLSQSVGQRLWQSSAGAQLTVTEAHGSGTRPALL